MIIDTLTAAAENELYPPVIRQALQAVLQQQPHALPPGKYPAAERATPGISSSISRHSHCAER